MERLRISDDGRYFEKPDGTPFTWLADTAWTMPQRLKWDDAEYFMEKRKSQGVTVLQIVALAPEIQRPHSFARLKACSLSSDLFGEFDISVCGY